MLSCVTSTQQLKEEEDEAGHRRTYMPFLKVNKNKKLGNVAHKKMLPKFMLILKQPSRDRQGRS
jgi:hypothetical protein